MIAPVTTSTISKSAESTNNRPPLSSKIKDLTSLEISVISFLVVNSGRFHSCTILSLPPLASTEPSGENAKLRTLPLCPDAIANWRLLLTSQSLIVAACSPHLPSPDANNSPSGLKAKHRTGESCPSKTCSVCHVSTSHKRIVRSSLPEASQRPAGLKTRALISSV